MIYLLSCNRNAAYFVPSYHITTHPKGNARIENVEFVNFGQDGWTESYDPRFGLAFLNLGTVSSQRSTCL